MAFSYQLIKTMTKLEKETKQQLYVFIKNDEIPDNSARIHLHAGMTFQLSYHTVQLQAWHLHCAIIPLIGLMMTNHVR